MQWSRGEYPRANNHEDDLALIAAHAPYRADDHTDSCPGATALAARPAAAATGVIGSAADADTFAFFAAAPGPVVVAVAVAAGAAGTADLDVQATVLDGQCRPVAVFNPPGQLAVPPSVYLAPAAGTYYVQVCEHFFICQAAACLLGCHDSHCLQFKFLGAARGGGPWLGRIFAESSLSPNAP